MSQVGMQKVQIVEYSGSKLTRPNIIVGLPEAGLVGSIAASYLAEMLKLPEIGYVDSELVPPLVVVEKSYPRYPIRIFGKEDIVIVVVDIPLTPRLATEFSTALVNWAVSKQSRLILGATGLPSKDRMEQKNEMPEVFYATTATSEVIAPISSTVQKLEEGIIVGTYALILKKCLTMNQPNVTLFAESHLDFPDPGAAAAVINVLKRLLKLDVDVKPLLEESEQVRLRSRELMKRTQQSMQQMSQEAQGLYA